MGGREWLRSQPAHLNDSSPVCDPGNLRLKPDAPREVLALCENPPIPGL